MDKTFLKILDKAIAPEPRKRPRGMMNLNQFLAGPAAELLGEEAGAMTLNEFLTAASEAYARLKEGASKPAAAAASTPAPAPVTPPPAPAPAPAAPAATVTSPAPTPAASTPPAAVAIDLDKLRSFTARVLGAAAVGDISTLSDIEAAFCREGVRLPFSKKEPFKFSGSAANLARSRQAKVDAFFRGEKTNW